MAKIDLEKIILAAFFALILFLGPGALFDHKIKHDFPFAYFASDSFQHQIRAEAIKDAGNFRYEASYISKGIENVVGRYPPGLYHLAIIMSYAAGTETYDSIYFVVAFFAIIGSLVMYLIIRNFNKTVALISLPLSALVFSHPLAIGFLWGHWPSILAQSFMVVFFWSIMRIDLEKSFIIIALLLAAIALTHTSELIFAFIFLALFFGTKILAKKLNKNDIKTMSLSLIIFAAASFYYLVIFYNTWMSGNAYSFVVEPVWNGNPGFYIAGFGLLLIPIIFGALFSLSKLKELHVSIILAFAMLLSGFLNYIGFGLRSFQIRFFWPIYLAVFFGFGIYIMVKFIVKKWNFAYTSAIFIVLIVLLSGLVKFPIIKQTNAQVIPVIPYLNRAANQGIMNPYHWEVLSWLSKNTEKNAKIYFSYGDIYGQDALLRNSKRTHYLIEPEDFINALQERKIKREYITEFPGDSGGGISYRSSFFGFQSYEDTEPDAFYYGPRDICNFDYYVFDKVSGQQVLAQYNLLIAQELLKKDFIKPIFENEVSLILKNNNPGDDCIEERSF
ncbi:hypothetical protein HYU50_00655 [Candidatus Woesearchaeota archaeon]|nr:hypothetical protein [Candidatus Woesearchaeota archaeon]